MGLDMAADAVRRRLHPEGGVHNSSTEGELRRIILDAGYMPWKRGTLCRTPLLD
jgi:hypothetical protein